VEDARGNVAEAARALGISRATVYRKLPRNPRSAS
jgi:transcriptional regulator of acetoin/glycerol metabolism